MVNPAREAESRAGYTRVFTPNMQEERDERRTWTRTKTKKIPAGWSFSFAATSEQLSLKHPLLWEILSKG